VGGDKIPEDVVCRYAGGGIEIRLKGTWPEHSKVGCHATVAEIEEKRWKTTNKSEYERGVGSRASSRLLDFPRKTSAAAKCD